MIRKINRKTLFIILCFLIVVAVSSIITWAVRSTPTEPVTSVVIQSDNYNNPGSWKIEKSARWTDKNVATISFNFTSIPKTNGHKKDVVLIVDNSQSMYGEKINNVKSNLKTIVNYILSDNQNKVSLITFNSSSEVLSNFTNDISSLEDIINDITTTGETNYNDSLITLDNMLKNYQHADNRDLVAVFLTDGRPTVDNPSQIVTYQLLKEKYPYLTINGIQYEIWSSIMDELIAITDYQYSADDIGLYNALIRASLDPDTYNELIINDYIESDYFDLNSIDDINTSYGTVDVTEENGKTKVIWDLGDEFISGNSAEIHIKVNLKNEYKTVPNLYPTNDHEVIISQIGSTQQEIKESDKTPVLKNYYTLTYDNNLPPGCSIASFPTENYTPYENVTMRQDKLSCDGYYFEGWKIQDNYVKRVGTDNFIMPEYDFKIVALWSKPSVSKAMDGTVHEKTTLYKTVENDALNNRYAATYTGNVFDAGGNQPIYYYYSNSFSKSYVSFGGYCWKIIRTTDTGGVKLEFYSVLTEGGTCDNTIPNYFSGLDGIDTLTITRNYAYGTEYTYDKVNHLYQLAGDINNYTWSTDYNQAIGKYTCSNTSATAKCSNLSYIISYNNSYTANVMKYNNTSTGNNIYTKFNENMNMLNSNNYMYNKKYTFTTKNMPSYLNDVLKSTSIPTTNIYYSSNYIYNSNYKLDNPSQITNEEVTDGNYSNLVNKYTLRSTNASTEYSILYYVVAVDGSTMYYLELMGGRNLGQVAINNYFGDNLVDNGDGTYTVSNNINTINKSDWFTNYSDANNKYTCYDKGTTCSNPYYVYNATNTGFRYEDGKNKYVYGNSFEYNYETNQYELKDTISFSGWENNYSRLKDYHYTCFNTTGKCQTVSYIYNVTGITPYIIYLKNNESVEDAIENMLYASDVNEYPSYAMTTLEWWFRENLENYSSYLEDVVFCNDRSYTSLGGWDPNGGQVNSSFIFNGNRYNRNVFTEGDTVSLECPNALDRFTVSSSIGNGKLNYPVGLITAPEGILASNNSIVIEHNTMTPLFFNTTQASNGKVNEGSIIPTDSTSYYYLNMVISLKPDTEYTAGIGTKESPYYVPTESN